MSDFSDFKLAYHTDLHDWDDRRVSTTGSMTNGIRTGMIKADRAEEDPGRCPEISEGRCWMEEMKKIAGSENVRVEMDMKDVNDNRAEMNSFEQRVAKLDAEIEAYRQAIRDAEDALDSAEKELDEIYAELDIPNVPEDLPVN